VEGCKEMRDSKTKIDNNGYLRFRDSNKLVHRWVMEKKLDRPLHEDELVHHINGNKKDNRPENLELMTRKEHFKEHAVPVIEARREAKIIERVVPILEAQREDKIIKAIFLGFTFFGVLLFIGGLIIRGKLEMWYIGLLFLIMGLVGWFIQRRKK
jgi:hypothetical protein